MNDTTGLPLLSFVVLAYNQERFVRDAVRGALEQTYSPLEVILSDDCSADGTYEAMQQMAAEYRGPHRIVLHRAPRNLGLTRHLNRVVELATGELIIGAAGDDVSFPDRTSLTYRAWQDSGRVATSLWGRAVTIDELGRECASARILAQTHAVEFRHLRVEAENFLAERKPAVLGCCHAFSPRLFSIFGPLHPENVMEDFQLGFRSVLAGAMTYIDADLVQYRRHGANLSAGQLAGESLDAVSFERIEGKRRRVLEQFLALFDGIRADLEVAEGRGLVSGNRCTRIEAVLDREVECTRMQRRALGVSGFEAARLAWKYWLAGGGPRGAIRLLARVLPREVFKKIVILANSWRTKTNA